MHTMARVVVAVGLLLHALHGHGDHHRHEETFENLQHRPRVMRMVGVPA